MVAKVSTLLGVLLAAVVAAASPAAAAAPTVTEVAVDRTFHLAAGTACSFPLTIHNKGIRRTTTFVDSLTLPPSPTR